MEFFDRKQEVIDIELTPSGKRLLQMGRFRPRYYAFYDDDIIYDGSYAGISEEQNGIEERIKETPRLKQQTYLYSAEQRINNNTTENDLPIFYEDLFKKANDLSTLGKINPETIEKRQLELEGFGPLGNMSYGEQKAPAWQVSFYEAPLTGTLSCSTGSNNQSVPKVECDVQYKIKIGQESIVLDDDSSPGNYSDIDEVSEDDPQLISEDGSHLILIEDSLFIGVLEKNTQFLNENFDVEISRILTDGVEERLYFSNDPDTDDPKAAEYFFEVEVDSEIPDEIYCRAVKTERLETTYTDKFIFKCPDRDSETNIPNVYDMPDDEVEMCD